ncbi:MAG TPA: tetratricopeptide repeat protein, partial [Candidatus Limnocylindrales bacterium]
MFTTGFNWPFPAGDSCQNAKKLILELPATASELKKKETEGRVMELCPTGAAGHYLKGLQFERSGHFEAAVTEYREALAIDPEFYPASGNLGLLHLKRGASEEAAVEISAGLKTGDPRYHAGLARYYAEKKLHRLAVFHFREALADFPGDASLHADLAASYLGAEQRQRGEDEYRKALSLEPGNASARLGLGALLLARGETDKAMGELKQAALAEPGNKEIHRLLAEGYSRRGDSKSAEYERVLAGIASKREAAPKVDHLALGDGFQAGKDLDNAITEYRLRISEEPT